MLVHFKERHEAIGKCGHWGEQLPCRIKRRHAGPIDRSFVRSGLQFVFLSDALSVLQVYESNKLPHIARV